MISSYQRLWRVSVSPSVAKFHRKVAQCIIQYQLAIKIANPRSPVAHRYLKVAVCITALTHQLEIKVASRRSPVANAKSLCKYRPLFYF